MSPFFKKIGVGRLVIAALVIIALAFCAMAVSASAEEISEPPVTDIAGGENLPSVDDNGSGEVNTPPIVENEPVEEPDGTESEAVEADIFTRVFEFVETNIDEILTAISVAVMAAYTLYQKAKNGTLISGIGRVLKSQGGVENASKIVSEAVAKLDARQEQLNRYYEEYSKNESERNKVTAALLVEVMALIETNHIAYINNSNIPQSMKNLMTSKYARCLSVINDDAELRATYDEMRGILGITEGATNEETTA